MARGLWQKLSSRSLYRTGVVVCKQNFILNHPHHTLELNIYPAVDLWDEVVVVIELCMCA
jgi:hypothetical protein